MGVNPKTREFQASAAALTRRRLRARLKAEGTRPNHFRLAGKIKKDEGTRFARFARKHPRAAKAAKWVAGISAIFVAINAPAMYAGFAVFGGGFARKHTTMKPEYALYESCRQKAERHAPCTQAEVEASVGPVFDNTVGMTGGWGIGGAAEHFLGLGRLFERFMHRPKTPSATSPAGTRPVPTQAAPAGSAPSR